MEFKERSEKEKEGRKTVDIGTEWNLKKRRKSKVLPPHEVDIGTEWNLKP